MKNTLLDIIQSFEHPMDLDDQEVREVLASIDDLTHRQIKNAVEALLDQYKSIQRGYKRIKTAGDKNREKVSTLEEYIKTIKEEGERPSPDDIKDMTQLLEEEGYSVHKAGETIAIMTDELPDQLRNKIQDEKLRTGKTVTYEKKKEIVMNALKKAGGN